MPAINSSIQLALAQLPPGVDPALARLLQPLYTALFSLREQISANLGETTLDPATYSSAVLTKELRYNTVNKCHFQNDAAALTAGQFVYMQSNGKVAASSSTNHPIGFATAAVAGNAWGEFVLGRGLITSTGLTPGANYCAAAAGGLAIIGTPSAVGSVKLVAVSPGLTATIGDNDLQLTRDSATTVLASGNTQIPVAIAKALSTTVIYVNIPIY